MNLADYAWALGDLGAPGAVLDQSGNGGPKMIKDHEM